jgi:hypothetical protein
MKSPPQRGPTHRVDTQAFRMLLSHLDIDWVVRSMEERDYGIDLQIEIFDGANPTGTLVFGQLKGTGGPFADEPSFQFPVKTLLYAEMFSAPFFLFRTSIHDGQTRFIWLQKFIETKVPELHPKWRTQGSIVVSMPEGNDLVKNKERFLRLAKEQIRERQALQFLRIEFNLALHGESVLNGEHAVGKFCSMEAKQLRQLREFLLGSEFQGEEDYKNLCELSTHFEDIANVNSISQGQREEVENCLEIMERIKIAYLSEPDIQQFTSTGAGEIYF